MRVCMGRLAEGERDEGWWWWFLGARPRRWSMFVFHIPLAAWPQLISLKAGKQGLAALGEEELGLSSLLVFAMPLW